MNHNEKQSSVKRNAFHQSAERGDIPLMPKERLWGFWEFTYANSALAIATWAFLIGGAVGLFVGPKAGIAAILIGNILGVVIVALAVTIVAGRYGVEQFTALRSQFGDKGSRLIYLIAVIVLTMGWLAVLAMMFGRSISGLSDIAFSESSSVTGMKATIAALLAILLTWIIVAKGPTSIKFFNMIISPALVVLMLVMLYLIFSRHSLTELLAMEAIDPPFTDKTLNFVLAVEINFAAGLSWWPYIGNLARLTKNERVAFWPNLVGIFAAASLGELVGLFAAVSMGQDDPTIWMATIGGVTVGFIALGFIACANVTSMANILYTSVVGLRQISGNSIRNISWGLICLIFCVIPLALVIIYPGMYDGFFIFLVWTAGLYAALAGIGIADYFFLRKQYLDVSALHLAHKEGPYSYFHGYNPSAIIALIAGFACYVWMFNPQTLNSHLAFRFLTASMPSFLTAACVHYILTKFVIIPRGWGGYQPIHRVNVLSQSKEPHNIKVG